MSERQPMAHQGRPSSYYYSCMYNNNHNIIDKAKQKLEIKKGITIK